MPAYINNATAAQGRIVPGTFWYAYGSVALDLQGYDEGPQHRPQLRVIDGGAARGSVPTASEAQRGRAAAARRADRRTLVFRCTVALALAAIAAAALALVCATVAGARSYTAVDVATEPFAVAEGDTLWSISERHPIEGMTTQQCVKWVMERNGLDSAVLFPGQVVEVPAAG